MFSGGSAAPREKSHEPTYHHLCQSLDLVRGFIKSGLQPSFVSCEGERVTRTRIFGGALDPAAFSIIMNDIHLNMIALTAAC